MDIEFNEKRNLNLCHYCSSLDDETFAQTYELKHTKKGTVKIINGKDLPVVRCDHYGKVQAQTGRIPDCIIDSGEIAKMVHLHKFEATLWRNKFYLKLIEEKKDA